MTSSVLVSRSELAAIPVLAPETFRASLLSQLGRGMRLVTLYGQRRAPTEDQVQVTVVLQAEDGLLHVARSFLSRERGYHTLTSDAPAFHCFERELHEQTGIRIAGHPWLKPIRYERADQAAMSGYPFYTVEGKEVHEVAVGPIHAGVIEPGSFRFACLGEHVHHLEVQLGYQHRGVEKRLLQGDARYLGPVVETIAGDSSVAHAWAYSAALESLADCSRPMEDQMARAIALELERVGMHLATLSGLAADAGFLQGATSYGRLRTIAINLSMQLCGSRFGRGAVLPGGGRMRLRRELLAEVLASIASLRDDLAIINAHFLGSRTVQHRLRHVGVLSEGHATMLGLVGVAARASGIPVDTRTTARRGVYQLMPVEIALQTDGDCWARARLRICELDRSLEWLAAMFPLFAHSQPQREDVGRLAPNQLAVSVVEGFRGEVVHCVETDASGRLTHYKVQDPSLRNWMGVAVAVRGNEISDFPICNKSFDLSYCGNDL